MVVKKPVEVEITTEDESESNAVNDIITEDMSEDFREEDKKDNQSIIAAIREMGETLFKKYPAKTSNITSENEQGMDTVAVINDWMMSKYRYEFTTLNTLVKSKRENVMSVKGYGVEKFIEESHSIQATFQQTEIPQNLANRMMRR
jgi:hypothetical protein